MFALAWVFGGGHDLDFGIGFCFVVFEVGLKIIL